jgi:hypothetical protein
MRLLHVIDADEVARVINQPFEDRKILTRNTLTALEALSTVVHCDHIIDRDLVRKIHMVVFSHENSSGCFKSPDKERHLHSILPLNLLCLRDDHLEGERELLNWYKHFTGIEPFEFGNKRVSKICASYMYFVRYGIWTAIVDKDYGELDA